MALLNVRKSSILLVESDVQRLKEIQTLLNHSGFSNVIPSINAQSAILELRRHKLDMIILECDLPDIPGLHLLKAFRSGNTKVPIVMISSKTQDERSGEAKSLGADAFYSLPLSAGDAVKRIDELLLGKYGITVPKLAVEED
jgi:DNA-binding response OmpR family regulator